jgi:tetratricopeptide (TPR) repeat protein
MWTRFIGSLRNLRSGFKFWLFAAVLTAFAWAWHDRGAVNVLPFEGSNGAAVSLAFAHALENVARGAMSGMDVDPFLQQATDTVPPPVSVPGTGISFASLVSIFQIGPLAETRVHGALAAEPDGSYQILLQVFGPGVAGGAASIREVAADLDKAVIQAAESLYGVLKPIALASYLYSRDPRRCLEVVADILADPHHSHNDEAVAYRLWGLVLRDRQDFDTARLKFDASIKKVTSNDAAARRFKAHIWVDRGHCSLWEQQWQTAADDYERAAAWDHAWAVPHDFWGDALAGGGNAHAAIRQYREAIRLDPLYVEPWNGMAQVHMARQEYQDAIDAYMQARTLHLKDDRTAALSYCGLGNAFFALGRADLAAEPWEHVAEIDASVEVERSDWTGTSACQSSNARVVYASAWAGSPAPTSDAAYVESSPIQPASAAGLPPQLAMHRKG